jgi:hypothetical protein
MTALSKPVVSLLLGLTCGVALAQGEDPRAVVAALRTCATEQDDTRRLACYDKQLRDTTPASWTNLRVAAVSHQARGEALITLDNGQVWQQSDMDDHVLVEPGDSVSIRQGMLGSFWLSTPKSGFKVRRVK